MLQFEEILKHFNNKRNEDEFIEFEVYPDHVDIIIKKADKQERKKLSENSTNKLKINSMLKKVRFRAEYFSNKEVEKDFNKCQITSN
jgi:bifunctional DNA-binding transcriptional regulator/antitoxin component of YhaV-PrlF toxin-antitoxin module